MMNKKCTKCNKETDRLYLRVWCKNCYEKEYRKNNPIKVKKLQKKYRTENADIIKKSKALWYRENKDRVKKSQKKNKSRYEKEYRIKNKDKINTRNRTYIKNKIKKDISFYLKRNLRNRLAVALKNNQKSGSAIKNLGCSIEELKLHLESKFQEGMTWENRGLHGWHVDHIIPLCKFDLTDPEQLKKACHYTNLQPLWASDNFTKGDKIL